MRHDKGDNQTLTKTALAATAASSAAAANISRDALASGVGGLKPRKNAAAAQRRASAPALQNNHYVQGGIATSRHTAAAITDFDLVHLLGSGGVGNVWYGVERETGRAFAVKIIEKHQIMGQTSIARVLAEREIMTRLQHPFIVNLHYAFQDDTRIFFVLDYKSGGDFYKMMKQIPNRKMDEADARFYAAEILLALEYLHTNGITFRDLKPENVLVSEEGHICVADFGLAVVQQHNARNTGGLRKTGLGGLTVQKTVCGTPEYMAPEVIREDGHGKMVDYWALGVMIYEMLFGKTPWAGLNATDMFFSVLTKSIPFPSTVSKPAKKLIESLMMKDPHHRLGRGGPQEVKNHDFFASTDWTEIFEQRVRPPFVPEKHFSKHKIERKKSEEAMEKFKASFKPYVNPSSENVMVHVPTSCGHAGTGLAAARRMRSLSSSTLSGDSVDEDGAAKDDTEAAVAATAVVAPPVSDTDATKLTSFVGMFKSVQGLAVVSVVDGRIMLADANFDSMMSRSKYSSKSILLMVREQERVAVKEALARALAVDQELRVHVIQPGTPVDEDRAVDVSLKHAPGKPGAVLWWQCLAAQKR